MKIGYYTIYCLYALVFAFLASGTAAAQTVREPETKLAGGPSIKVEKLDLFDKIRNRKVPVAIYSSSTKINGSKKISLAIVNHGYGMKNMEYSFIAEALVASGYLVASIQHEIPGDEPIPTTGKPSEVRRPNWERGVQNILLAIGEIKKVRPEIDAKNLLLVGHSNGGDIAMLFVQKYPNKVRRIITLDNRRVALPRVKKPKILSIRSSDQQADEGILPTLKVQEKFGIEIVKLPNTIHNDMWDRATFQQKQEIVKIISHFLIEQKRAKRQKGGDLMSQLRRAAEIAQGRVGIAAMVLETGESVALKPSDRFPMQSVFKLPIAMAVLKMVDAGEINLDRIVRVEQSDLVGKHLRSPIRDKHPNGTEMTVSELLRSMVSESDGTACDLLLGLIGGPAMVNEYLRVIGVRGIKVVNTEKEIGADREAQYRNWATPEAMTMLLRRLHEGKAVSARSTSLLWGWMIDTPTGARRLKHLLPKETIVAHKTGTSHTVNGITAATNDVGVITLPDGRHLVLAVFLSDSTADEATREGVIAKTARIVWDNWVVK